MTKKRPHFPHTNTTARNFVSRIRSAKPGRIVGATGRKICAAVVTAAAATAAAGRIVGRSRTRSMKEKVAVETTSTSPSSSASSRPLLRRVAPMSRLLKKRYLVSLLVCLGTCILIMLQLNLSITIVQMTSAYNVTVGNETYVKEPEFAWDSQAKGLILSISAYGILFSPFGGILARKFGGATVFGTGLATSAILTLLTPFTVRQHIALFVAARLLEGISQGIIGASLMEVFIRWTPPDERSRLIVNGINGYYLGAAVTHPISGYIAQHYGWEAVFFFTGGVALTWYLIWVLVVSNGPAEDRFISASEKAYLIEKIPVSISNPKIIYPWKSILTSKPVWALLNEFFTLAWSFSFVVHNLPLYINDVQNRSIETIGMIASVPNICSLIGSPVAAFLNDYLRSRHIMRIQTIYKTFVGFGQISAIILLIVIALWMDFEGSIICFSLFRFCFSFAETSYEVLPADLAAQYASLIRGMSITTMAIGFILSPTVMGFVVADRSRKSWNTYFLILSIFNFWSLVMFWVFGSAEPQPWAEPQVTATAINDEPAEQINRSFAELSDTSTRAANKE